jgi:hypothetical protein
LFDWDKGMLLFGNSEKRDPAQTALIRSWVADVLTVPEDAFVMVKQVECLEEGCPPVETIIAILSDHEGPKQWKVRKPIVQITEQDIRSLASVDGKWTPSEWRCPD